jgi:acyl-CoA hydrolase
MRNGLSSAGTVVSNISCADDDYMASFADIVRTHVFDQYPHVNDIEANA